MKKHITVAGVFLGLLAGFVLVAGLFTHFSNLPCNSVHQSSAGVYHGSSASLTLPFLFVLSNLVSFLLYYLIGLAATKSLDVSKG